MLIAAVLRHGNITFEENQDNAKGRYVYSALTMVGSRDSSVVRAPDS